ncbi:MAG: glycoside hydrolase family 6 protein [Candidatus Sulfotelmatobacter sp.]
MGEHTRLSLSRVVAFVVLCFTIVAPRTFAQHVTNPYAGASQYLNPDYTSEVNTAIAAQTAGSTLAKQMAVVETYPTAVWLDHMGAIAGGSSNNGRMGLQQHINAALAQQAASGSSQPIVFTLVVYDLPDRDCAALASNGEISINPNPPTQPLTGIQTYEQNFITPIFNILQPFASNSKIRFVLIIEDDSLPNLITNTGESPNPAIANCVAANGGVSGSPSLTGVYVQAIQYALNTFHPLSNVYQYLDVGHHGWLGWPNNFNSAIPFLTSVVQGTTAGLGSIDGFITNTANYGPTKEPYMTATEAVGGSQVYQSTFYQFDPYIDEEDYAAGMDAAFVAAGFPSTLGFLIDTSRNGWGGPNRPSGPSSSTDLNTFVNATKIDERDDMGQWCNQQNSGLGVPPTVNPGGFANLSAYVWIKPPGESDGNYPGSVYNGVTSTTGDPNCDPAHDNALANNMPTDALPNSPSAGTFWTAEFTMLIQNAFPAVPSSTAPGFSISASGATVEQGTSAASSVTVNSINGFNGTITLSVSGLPSGVTATFNPTSVTGSSGSTLTFTASNTATVGAATATVTGTSGSTTASTTLTLTVTAEPNFTISASPTAVTVPPGTSVSSTITIGYVGGLTGSVSVSASGLPSGVQANFSPSSVNSSGTVSVSFFAQTGTAPGTTNVTITGTDGSISHSTTIAVTIPGSSGFTLAASPSSLTITQGSSGSSTISVTDVGGFTGSVTLAASGLPSGVTASFGTNPTTSTSVLTLTASSTATTGAFTVTVTGTSGSLTATTTIALAVNVKTNPGFTLAASPSSLTITQGSSGTSTISVTDVGGFTGSVTLAASGLPSGVTASFGTNPTTSSSVLTLTASSTVTTGSSTVTITGTSGALSATTTIALTINTKSTPGFTLAASPSSLTVNRGSSGTSTITVTDVGGFTGSVTLAASGLPSGVTASFGTNPTTGSSVLTLSASSTATTGSSTVTITGTSGTLSATTTIALTVSTGTSGFACHINYTITNQWPGGFGTAITINNTGTTSISNWTLTWAFANGQTVTQIWNGSETQSGANVTVTNLSYNGTIPAGGNYNGMGFNGSWNNTTNAVPTSFAVNGTTCN